MFDYLSKVFIAPVRIEIKLEQEWENKKSEHSEEEWLVEKDSAELIAKRLKALS